MYNRKIGAIVMVLMMVFALAFGFMGRPIAQDDSLYVTDAADILSREAEKAILDGAKDLLADTDAGFYVATVDSTGRLSTEKYAYELCDRWKLTNYDMLLLLSEGDDDYYFLYGGALNESLEDNYRHYMDNFLEPAFARGDYDGAVLAFFERVSECIRGYQAIYQPDVSDMVFGAGLVGAVFGLFGRTFIWVILFVVVCLVIACLPSRSRRRRRVTRMPGEPRRMEPGPFVGRAPMSGWETGGRVNDWHMPSHKERPTGRRSSDFGGITSTTVSRARRTSSSRSTSRSSKPTFSGGGRSSVTRSGGGRSGGSRSGGGRR